MKIFTIIVTYKGQKWYNKCFSSLTKSNFKTDIIAIDNNSNDGTIEYIKENYPSIHLIESKENLGFAKANNIGIKYALDNNADYVFLLNQDAWVEQNTIEELIKTFEENKNVGIASPIHLNGSYNALDFGFSDYVKNKFVSDCYFNKMQKYYKIPFVNAAAWLINSKCIKDVGGFDTSLFTHYGEDYNYTQRVIYHGYNIYINTQCTICHDREQRGNEETYRKKIFGNQNKYLELKSMLSNILDDSIDDKINRDSQNFRKNIIKSYIKLNIKQARKFKEELELINKIIYSREKNKIKGTNWL